MSALWASLSRGEQLLVGGAALIFVIGDLLLGRLLGGFGVDSSISIAAALAIVFVYVEHTQPVGLTWPLPYPVVLLVLTVILDVFALDSLLSGLRGGLFGQSTIDVLVSLCVWIGAAVMSVGWYLHWTIGVPATRARAA
jgi:hypothetical protein